MPISSASRLPQLGLALKEAGADAFFAWHPVTMGYLHNFHEGAIERFLALGVNPEGKTAIICPSLSETQARRAGITDVRSWRDGEDPLALFSQLADEWNLRTGIIAVDDELPAHMLLAMQGALPAALFKPGGEVISGLMRVKSPAEIDLLRKAAAIADSSFDVILGNLKAGLTEREVDHMLRNEMARRGGTPVFAIIASGENGAEPHHLSDDTVIKDGDVVILDFGCEVEGYLSDITRTVAIGHAPEGAAETYKIVHQAFMSARESIRPGIACEQIDRAARGVIENAGYGEFFMHRTGHGIGLRAHEEPFIIAGNKNPVDEGHCFSVEPGIYLPGRFGIRVENIVTVVPEGHESLNAEPASGLLVV